MATVGDLWGSGLFKANACDFCDDVTTELADISLGDAWLHPYSLDGLGNSVVVTRSELAEKIMQEGIANKTLKADLLSLNEFKRSQQGSFSHRQDALYYRIDQTKKAGKLVPEKRERFHVKIPFYFKRVQKQRMNVRKLSLEIWKEKKQAIQFEEKIAARAYPASASSYQNDINRNGDCSAAHRRALSSSGRRWISLPAQPSQRPKPGPCRPCLPSGS